MTKAEIRTHIAGKRRDLNPAWVAERSANAQRIVLGLPEMEQALHVGCYLSLPGEVMTADILQYCWAAGKRVSIPTLREESGRYEMAAMAADTPVSRRPGGGPEPVDSEWVRLADVDLLILPGVAFDPDGGRLGRGGGHYDRLVAEQRDAASGAPLLVGLCFEFQILECVPMAAHDVRLDCVATEDRVIRVRGSKRTESLRPG